MLSLQPRYIVDVADIFEALGSSWVRQLVFFTDVFKIWGNVLLLFGHFIV